MTTATPTVDVRNLVPRTVMTREIMDDMPTGRSIQALGIVIPGTDLQLGAGAALSRGVGGTGTLHPRFGNRKLSHQQPLDASMYKSSQGASRNG